MVDGNWYRIAEVSDRIASKLQKQGHTEDAEEIRQMTSKRDMPEYLENSNNNHWYRVEHPTTSLDDLIVPHNIKDQIKQILKEYDKRQLLKKNGLHNANKILLLGTPGTGKTMTAEILANSLDLPLKTIRQENLIESRMGKTANNLDMILPSYGEEGVFPAVYFFDEFDTIASRRIDATQAGDREYNEITNVLLKEMDHINPDCFLVCASNLSAHFDRAVFRRFDMVITFPSTTKETVRRMLLRQLNDIAPKYVPSDKVCQELLGFPPSVIKSIALDAKKQQILDETKIDDPLILKLAENKRAY